MSAAALIIQEGQILLVRHYLPDQYDFWLPPGGRLEGAESIFDCARREAFEETGLSVELDRIVYVQEFVEPGYHFCKFFILCPAFSGSLSLAYLTAQEDFLVDARFFTRQAMAGLIVRPEILKGQFWSDLEAGFPSTRYLGLQRIEA